MASIENQDLGTPEWDWLVRKVDVRGAINVYFSLLMAERYVVNMGEADLKKTTLCARPLDKVL